MTDTTPTPADQARVAGVRRDYDARREALAQAERTVHVRQGDFRAPEEHGKAVVAVAGLYLAFLTGQPSPALAASAGETTPDGLPVIRVGS